MKTTIVSLAGFLLMQLNIVAQSSPYTAQMEAIVSKLDSANTINDYQIAANDFNRMSNVQKDDWLPYYFAAFCNAKICWLYQEDPDKIEPFVKLAQEQIKKAQLLLDTATQKKELSEVYCVKSMVYRAYVFINPMSNGKKYGPLANIYTETAKKLNSDNPRAIYLDGWLKHYTPKLWGGDKKQAKILLEEALEKLDAKPSLSVWPHWGKTECEEILKNYKLKN